MPVKHLKYSRLWYLMAVFALLLAGVLLLKNAAALYWGPLQSDLTNQFYPWRVFIHRWFQRGVIPYWDPHIFSGYPTVETQQMLNLSPVHLLSILLPPHWGLSIFTVVNTAIALAGTVWALRRWAGLCPLAATLGAVLYTFGAVFALRVMAGHFTVVAAMAWWPVAALPLIPLTRMISATRLHPDTPPRARLFSGLLILRDLPRARRLLAVSALAHAMVCLAGAPQYIVYLFYIDLAVLAAAARRPAHLWPALTLAGVAWVLALLVSAPQWLPALWYLPYTGRALSSGGTSGWSFGPLHNLLLEMIMPFPFGDDLTRGHLHFKNVWETGTYPGMVAFLLTLALLLRWIGWLAWRRGSRKIAPMPVVGVAALFIILLGCYMMVGGWLPGFGGFREPLKARALLAFGFALGAASTIESLLRSPGRWRLAVLGAAVLLGAALAQAARYTDPTAFVRLIMSFGPPMDPLAAGDYRSALESPALYIVRYKTRLITSAALLAIAAALIVVQKRRARRGAATAAIGLLSLIAVADVLTHHHGAWQGRHLWKDADLPREVREYFAPRLADAATAGELPWRVLLAPGIINRTHHLEGLYETLGYDPLMPAHGAGRSLIKGMSGAPESDRATNLARARAAVGIRYQATEWLPDPTAATTLAESVTTIPAGQLIEVTRRVYAESPGENVFGPDLDGNHYVLPAELGGRISVVPAPPEDFVTEIAGLFSQADDDDATSAPAEVEYLPTGRPDEFAVRVTSPQPQLVVLKMTWLPGWRVLIDDEDAGRALFANNWMPAAIAPPGESVITFRYRPVAWSASLMLGAMGAVLVAGCWISGKRGRRRRRANTA